MKLTVTQENLNQALNLILPAIRPRGILPILEHVLLRTQKGKLILAATNLEIGIETAIGAKIDKEGSITIPARPLAELVAGNNDETIDITVENLAVTVKSQHYSAKFQGLSSEEFPPLPEPTALVSLDLPVGQFLEALGKTVFAAGQDTTRPALTGVYLKVEGDILTLVATDSYRLAEYKLKLASKYSAFKVIVPARTLLDVKRLILPTLEKVILELGESQATLKFGPTRVMSRLVEGEFPDYQQIIPQKNPITVDVVRAELLQAIRMVSIFAREVAGTIKLKVLPEEKKLELLATSPQAGSSQATVAATIVGGPLTISFNCKFLADVLTVVQSQNILLEFSEPTTPAVITEPDQDYLYVVMPLKED